MQAGGDNDVVQPWLQRFCYHGLQGMDHEWCAQAHHVGDVRCPAGDGAEHSFGFDKTSAGMDTFDFAITYFNSRDRGFLMNFDTSRICTPGVRPSDSIVSSDGTRRMVQRSVNRSLMATTLLK